MSAVFVASPLLLAAGIFMFLALALALLRLAIGPSTPDRVVAADTVSVIVVSALGGLALVFDSPLYLDIALVTAALAFVGVVAIARAIEPARQGEEE